MLSCEKMYTFPHLVHSTYKPCTLSWPPKNSRIKLPTFDWMRTFHTNCFWQFYCSDDPFSWKMGKRSRVWWSLGDQMLMITYIYFPPPPPPLQMERSNRTNLKNCVVRPSFILHHVFAVDVNRLEYRVPFDHLWRLETEQTKEKMTVDTHMAEIASLKPFYSKALTWCLNSCMCHHHFALGTACDCPAMTHSTWKCTGPIRVSAPPKSQTLWT